MKLVKGVIYEVNDGAMDFFIKHNRVEYHSHFYRKLDNKRLNTCIIRDAEDSLETYTFYDEDFKCVAQLQEI